MSYIVKKSFYAAQATPTTRRRPFQVQVSEHSPVLQVSVAEIQWGHAVRNEIEFVSQEGTERHVFVIILLMRVKCFGPARVKQIHNIIQAINFLELLPSSQ